MTSDMRTVIIPKSDQQNADDFLGGPRTITVSGVSIRPGTEQPVSIHFEGDNNKPYKPCKSMARVMVQLWGPDANNYTGRSMTLYNDPKVLWAGLAVGGIRISHMSHIDGTANLMLTATKGSRKPFVVQPLTDHQVSAFDRLMRDARAAADDGDEPLTTYLKGLTRDQRDTLRPHGDALRARAAASGQRQAQNAPSPPQNETGTNSDDEMIYHLMTETGEQTFDSEVDYLRSYRAIVGALYSGNKGSALLAFDKVNKPLIEAVVGLADAVAAVNAEIRRPAGELGI